MEKRKLISLILSLAMMFSGIAIPVTAEEAGSGSEAKITLPDGYSFIDAAHNGNVVVAMAKDGAKTAAKLYYSADGGVTWAESENQPLASNAGITKNLNSQQQLVYWEHNKIFVAHGTGKTYTSSDGVNWMDNTAIHWTTDTMLTASGENLVFAGLASANATSDLATKQFANNKYSIPNTTGINFKVVAAKPAEADGTTSVLVGDKGRLHTMTFKPETPKYTWAAGGNNASAAEITANPYDALYAKTADQYLVIDGSETVVAVKDANTIVTSAPSAGTKVTGIGASDKYIVAGMENGKLYYTANAEITADTAWTEISVSADSTAATEPIKNIEFLDDDNFAAFSNTQVYKGDTSGYKNINDIEASVTPPTQEPTEEPTAPPTEEPTPEPEKTFVKDGYHLMDVARKGNTLVAMAKSENNALGQLYYSDDGGSTWQNTQNNPSGIRDNSLISGNDLSQQQLVYWAEKNIFVAHSAKSTYSSADGITWAEEANLHWNSNTMIATSGKEFVAGTKDLMSATSDMSAKKFDDNKKDLGTTGYYTAAIAAKPADSEGNIEMIVINKAVGDNPATICGAGFKAEGGAYTWTDVKKGYGKSGVLYDAMYSEKAGQYLAVNGTANLQVITQANAQTMPALSHIAVLADDKVTGVNANANHIIVGMESGKMFYTAAAPLASTTAWTEIPVLEGATAATEPIKNIEFLDDGSFVALGATQVYKGDITGYKNINDKSEEPTPTPTEEPTPTPTAKPEEPEDPSKNPFYGVQLMGGAYNGEVYVVYGNVTNADESADAKKLGRIFTSTDCVTWEMTADNVTTFSTQKNGAVWWEAQNKFVISGVTDMFPQTSGGTVGLAMVSADGSKDSWEMVTTTDFRVKTDIVVRGDKLYTTNHGRRFRMFTGLDVAEGMTEILLNGANHLGEAQGYYETIAMSNSAGADNIPSVFLAYNGSAMVRDKDSAEAEEANRWKKVTTVGGSGQVSDAVYSDALGKFVVTLNGGYRTSVVSLSGGNGVQGPVVSGKVCSALDTNGEDFMFACEDGGVYTAADDENFIVFDSEGKVVSKAELKKVPLAKGEENTLPVTNVITMGDKFLAIATDGKNSDILTISKAGDSYSYVKFSDSLKPEPVPETYDIKYENGSAVITAPNGTYALIFAAYDDSGILTSVEYKNVEIANGEKTETPETFTLDGAASGKVMLWNNMKDILPLAMVEIPFN